MARTADTGPLAWLRRALVLALTALAAWLAARLVLTLLEPSRAWQPVARPAPASAAPAAARTYDFSSNPFTGGDAVVPEAPAEPSSDAPETTLNLTLTGLRAGTNGSAIIRTPDGDEDNYNVGDTVLNGVVLLRVMPDHALLEVNGQTQRLTTADAKAAARAPAGSASAPTRSTTLVRAPGFDTLSRQANLVPVEDDSGQRIGIRVEPRNSALNLADYGLRRTDVVTQVGNVSLTSGALDVAALRRLGTSGRPVPVSILRDGQPLTLTLGGPR